MSPPWFREDKVELQKDGSITVSFECNGQPGVLRTFYDNETCVSSLFPGNGFDNGTLVVRLTLTHFR